MNPQTTGLTRDFANMAVTRFQAKNTGAAGGMAARLGTSSNRTVPTTMRDDHMEDSKAQSMRAGDEDSDNPEESSDESTDEGENIIESAYTELAYDVSELSPDGKARAELGLQITSQTGQMYMSFCREFGTQPRAGSEPAEADRYEFRISDMATVIVGKQGTSLADDSVRCSCQGTSNSAACKHVFWLQDQLVSASAGGQTDFPVLPFGNEGLTIGEKSPSRIMQGLGSLERVAAARHWEIVSEPSTPVDMQDILSVFQPNDAFDLADAQQWLERTSPNRLRYNTKYEEFGRVISQHAQNDPSLGIKLERLVTPAVRARAIFDRIAFRIPQVFNALHTHEQRGATASALQYDPRTCATKLELFVQRIHREFQNRITDDPAMTEAANAAVGALLDILEQTTKWNKNVYTSSLVHATRGESPELESNVYLMLIGSNTYQPRADGKLFAIETLKFVCMPRAARPNILHDNHFDALKRVTEAVKRETAPHSYITALEDLMAFSRKRPGDAGVALPSSSRQRFH